MKISIEQQISEAEAEIAKRHFVYGRLISAGNMRRSEADVLIARMEAVLATLRWVARHQAVIEAAVKEAAQ